MWQRLKETLSEPRLVTGGTVAAYLVLLALGVDLIPLLTVSPWWHWIPAMMMVIGAGVGLPCAWVGGQTWARWELVAMPISVAGLLGGVIIEATELWQSDFAAEVLVALGIVVLIIVIVRWVWLRKHYEI